MRTYKIRVLFFILCCLTGSLSCYAQDIIAPPQVDSLHVTIMDSTKVNENIYIKIHDAAQKRRLTKHLHDLVFDYKDSGTDRIIEDVAIEDEFRAYSGKPIRNINIISLSPFGTSINNPDKVNKSFLINFNPIHINTLKFIIKNSMFFKEGDKVNPYIIAQTEAHMRELGYINDARIHITKCSNSDSVDVTVITHDKFSLGVNIRNVSLKHYDIELYDKNFMGLGSELGLRLINNKDKEPPMGYGISFINHNIFQTFIRYELSYLKHFHSESFKVSVERPVHPSLRYLGGLSYLQYKTLYPVYLTNDTVSIRNELFSATFGRILKFSAKNKETSRLAIAGRLIMQNNLSELPPSVDYEYLYYPFARKTIGLLSTSLFREKLYRSSMLYNFGVTEDVAYGYNITAQVGYENHTYFNRMYSSFSTSWGKYHKIGYFYTLASIDSYFRNKKSEQGTFRLYTSYYSPLINFKRRGFFRQFVSVDYTKGIRRLDAIGEFLFFSKLSNFNTSKYNLEANGVKRFMINTESNWFSPLTILGFRTVIFSFVNIAWLGDENKKLFQSNNFFSGIGIGIRTRNDQLVFKTIQIKFALYPNLNQHKFSDFYNFQTSNPSMSPSFKPEYPKVISFE